MADEPVELSNTAAPVPRQSPLPSNLRSPLDRDAPSRRSGDGPLLPLSLVPPHRNARASYWTLLWFPIVCFTCFLFSGYVRSEPWWQPYLPDPSASDTPAQVVDGRIQVPPLDPDLWKRCVDLLPAPKGMFTSRLGKLVDTLDRAEHTAVWVAEPGPSVEYFLGAFGAGSWSQSERPFLVAVSSSAHEAIILTPAFEEARARQRAMPAEVAEHVTWVSWAESESPYDVLMDYVGRDSVLVIDGAVRSFIADGLRARGRGAADATVASAVSALRERKDEREIELMRCANAFTLHAIRKTRAKMYIGISESQTRAALYDEMKYLGLQEYGALVLFGENAALPHGSGTDRFLQRGEFVLIDAGGKWGGYVSDITRTFSLRDSDISDEHRAVWEIVRAGQLAPANLLRMLEAGDKPRYAWLDDRARETVKKGMAAYGVTPAKGHGPDYTVFTHRLGHGIGLEGHESPYAVQGAVGDRIILPGHTLTFEPGVYVPKGSEVADESVRGLGVRLEDVVVVREDKDGSMRAEWLTGPVKEWGDV